MALPPDLAHIHHVELLTTRPEESLRFFVDILGLEVEAQNGAVGLPARLGRVPALRPEADGGASDGDRAPRDPGMERGRAPARGGRDRVGWSRGRLDRGRPRSRPGVPLHRPRRARARGPLRGRALRAAAGARAVAQEPASALYRTRRLREAARPRKPPRGRCPGRTRVRDRRARLPALRAGGRSTTEPKRAPG